MTKSTKIIAALGVAAGLGIAALPAGAIFADTDHIQLDLDDSGDPVSADVTVNLTVGEAIALGVENVTCAYTDESTADGGDENHGAAVSLTISDTGSCSQYVAGGTNAADGFNLTVEANGDSFLALANADEDNEKIFAASDITNGGWNISGGSLTNHAVSGTPAAVITTAAAGEQEELMTYNFATTAEQAAGKYSGVITYTVNYNH